jgi:hypothetical protein
MFRVYLKALGRRATNTVRTTDPDAAKAAFAELVNRSDLDGTDTVAMITRHAIPIARHDFKAVSGNENYWRGRVVDLNIRSEQGRPPEIQDAKRVNIYLDPTSIKRAKEIGKGNISDGIRVALKFVHIPEYDSE